jgi:hypothetical protein
MPRSHVNEERLSVRATGAAWAAIWLSAAWLALLLHDDPALDNVAAGRRVGKHENWARYWRRIWATDGFRLADRAGRGRKPAFPPSAGGDRHRARLRTARHAGRAAQPGPHG